MILPWGSMTGCGERKRRMAPGLSIPQRMEKFEEAPDGTLAQAVTSKNKYARRYIHMVLGKVQMCERYEDLKKYPTSITRECMKYQNRVASAIKPRSFLSPLSGKTPLKSSLNRQRGRRVPWKGNLKSCGSR